MALDNFGASYTQEEVDKFGKRLLEKYGVKACECASRLDDSNIDKDTSRSYKPQVRQVVSKTGSDNPDPEEAVQVITEVDKKANTKNVMVVAMKKYYNVIGEPERGEELHKLAKDQGVAEIDFNREMEVEEWVTKEEVEQIEKYVLPDEGERWHEISGPNKSWVITLEHKALVMTLFYTGARVGEVCAKETGDEALSVEDLYPESDQIRLYRLKKKGKGYKRDMKVVPGKLWDVLDDYMGEYGITEGPLFPFVKRTAQNRITDIHEAYTYSFGDFSHTNKLTPHKFRHGRVTDLANHSSLEEAGQYVEHSSSEITNAYRHMASQQQRKILPEESDSIDEEEALKGMMDMLGTDDPQEALEMIEDMSS